ncbi:MAG: sugar phosphate nucleotidyltransferase [Bacteroidetes bacterium]|nr:sugar phosphate nucleotidyltransferase [Bacteroidota bacterium]MCL5738102.1 sugar phosphate nucleotidyltransferase [Bacteroidota bacterium]
MLKAVIMAGGFGTRLRPLTSKIPKPMVPIMNKPMIEHIVRLLVKHGINEIVVLVFYHPNAIKNFLKDGSQFGASIQYVKADADYGTAGSVRNAYELLQDSRILVISGDVLTDFDLKKAIEFHESRKSKATLVLTRVNDPLQFGLVITEKDGKIVRFLEKPTWGEVFSDTVNTGIYVIEPDVLEMVPYRDEYDFSKELFPQMLKQKMPLYGYAAEGYWRDVGNLNEYIEAQLDCLDGKVSVTVDGKLFNFNGAKIIAPSDFQFPQSLSARGTVIIGNNVTLGDDVELADTIIGDNSSIDSSSSIHRSILWDNVHIGSRSKITGDVIGSSTIVNEQVEIEENVFISDDCIIGKRAHIRPNVKLWPKKVLDAGATLSRSLVWEDKWLSAIFTDARVTGTSNIEMNPEFAAKLGASFGSLLGPGKYAVCSRDSDTVSRMINRALIVGFMSSGTNVYDLRSEPIPIVRHELRSGKAAGGVHVRKSPFDPDLTDIIFFDADGRDLSTSKARAVERLFFGEEYARAPHDQVGDIYFPERTNESYREDFIKALDIEAIRNKKFNIVIDYSHGVASTLFPTIVGSLNTRVVALNAYLDPKRLTRTQREVDNDLKQLEDIVKSLNYDFGFMFDAGAEKIFVVNEHGKFVDEDRLLSLITKLFAMAEPEAKRIAVPFSASREIDLIAAEHRLEVVRTKATHQALMNAAYEGNFDFVGGTKGGFIFPKFLFASDAMFSVAKILEMSSKTQMTVSELDRMIPKLHMVKKNLDCPWSEKGSLMRRLIETTQTQKRETIDGIKVHYEDGTWIHLLPDKERPLFHINAESESKELAQSTADDFESRIVNWLSDWAGGNREEKK